MNKPQQVALLGVLLIVIVAVGGWRTWSAVREARNGGPAGRQRSNAEWLEHLKVVSVDTSPAEQFQPTDNPLKNCARLPHVPIAKLRWRDMLGALEVLDQGEGGLPFPIHNKVLELGGNCIVKGSIDDSGPDLEPGEGWVELTVAVMSTGKVPFARLPKRHAPMCIITEVFPDGERKGLEVGDVVVSVPGFDLSTEAVEGMVCNKLVDRINAFKPQEPYTMTTVKRGALTEVARFGGDEVHFRITQVPVLDSDLTP